MRLPTLALAALPLLAACASDHYVYCKDPWCVSCQGKGHLRCPRCAGRKSDPCRECRGTGFVEQISADGRYGVYGGFSTAVCPRCTGRGELACRVCGGDGVADCGRTVTLHHASRRATETRDGAPSGERDMVKSLFLSGEAASSVPVSADTPAPAADQ